MINGRANQQRLHIPYVRQLVEKVDYRCNSQKEDNFKYFPTARPFTSTNNLSPTIVSSDISPQLGFSFLRYVFIE